jgi:L-ribulose-5-phosphate 3-epimerase UlaE
VKQNASTVRFVNNITEACFEEKVTQKLNIMKESYEQTLSKCFHLHKVINSDVL